MSGWGGDEVPAAYDRSFARLCGGAVEALLEAALGGRASAGRLLDVGTGTGQVAASARAARVVACDREPAMAGFAGRVAIDAHVVVATLPALPFADGAFDTVTANFVLNHVADPPASVTEVRRVLAPGGRFAATVWASGPTALNPLWDRVIDESGAVRPVPTAVPDALDFERTTDGLADLLRRSGLDEVAARTLDWMYEVAPDDLWAAVEARIAGIGTVYAAQPEAGRRRVREVFLEVTDDWASGGLLRLPSTAVVASGVRAD